MRESICGAIWRKSSAFNFSGAVIFKALAEIVSVLIMRNLCRGHRRRTRRTSLFASTEIANAYVQASGTNKNVIYTTASAPTIRAASDMRSSRQLGYGFSTTICRFEEWVENCLVSTLSKGDVVVMDNLRAHKGPRVKEMIKAAGAELRYLPPYSPEMNPIEKAFSKLKAHLRKIAERTVAALMCALETCADIFKPAECANYFAACGYDPP
jgi:transposase